MAPRLSVKSIALSERQVEFRSPFRFGAVTVLSAPQLFVHVEVDIEGRGRSVGASAELMVPKWFNKDPRLSADETVEQLRKSVSFARDLYLADPSFNTAFGMHAERIASQVERCARAGIPALAACFGPAEIDKAIFDALLRAVEGAEDTPDEAAALIYRHRIDAKDAVIAVAASGSTPFTLACLREASARGALTVNSPDTFMRRALS